MKLPIPLLFSKKAAPNFYLVLLLRDEKAGAFILREEEGKLKIVGKSENAFFTNFEELPFNELLESLDKTISEAEETLPPDVETKKTVFGVKESWVEEKKIKKNYLSMLKKLCDELSLQPIGFMVINEAISHLLSKEEGAPLSAVLVEITKQKATLTLFRAGKILETHSAKIEDSISKTVDRILHHFTVEVLPSRLIVFNGTESQALAQEFIAHQWSKSIPFLHVPQISVLPQGFDGKAIVFGAAEQMGFSVLDSLGDITAVTFHPDEKEKQKKEAHHTISPTTYEQKEEKKAESGKNTESNTQEKDELFEDASKFGFVMDEDIATTTPLHTKTETDEQQNDVPRHFFDQDEKVESLHTQLVRSEDEIHSQKSSLQGLGIVSMIATVLVRIPIRNPLKVISNLHFRKRMILLPTVLLLFIGIILWYFMSLKAIVTLHMQPKRIQETVAITLRADTSNDLSQKILSAKVIEASLDGSVSTNATGKKEVGDKAKGVITLYNSSNTKKTVPAGTVLISSNDLEFVTDKETVVASASGDIFSGIKSGTSQVGVTAKNIGTEYNLPSNTKFTIPGTSSLAGKNDNAFSGGTKKEVTVVAKKDIDTLTANLAKDLEGRARNVIKDKVSSDRAILPIFTNITISKKSVDNDIGEEAKKVTMTGTVLFRTLEYSTSDLNELAKSALKGRYSQDLAISEKGISARLENINVTKDEVTASLVMNAALLPKLDKNTLVQELTGKSFDDAKKYLTTIPQIRSADIVLSPNIPFLPKLLPRRSSNITVVLQTNE